MVLMALLWSHGYILGLYRSPPPATSKVAPAPYSARARQCLLTLCLVGYDSHYLVRRDADGPDARFAGRPMWPCCMHANLHALARLVVYIYMQGVSGSGETVVLFKPPLAVFGVRGGGGSSCASRSLFTVYKRC